MSWFIVSALVLISTAGTLSFGFWKDDWISYWGANAWSPLYYLYWYHPGTTIQFALLTHLLEPNTLGWQIVGVFWKLAASLALYGMMVRLTESKRIGLIAGAILASSALGLDAVGWPSANVVFMASALLCVSVSAWIDLLKNKKGTVTVTLLLLSISLFVDPFRTFPLLLFIVLLIKQYSPQFFQRITIPRKLLFFLIPVILLLSITWLPHYVADTTIVKFISQTGLNLNQYREKLYVIANYPATITNIVAGTFVQVPEEMSTGIYDRVSGRLGIILITLLFFCCLWLWKIQHKYRFPFLFFCLWLVVFYLPNYMSEVRLTMGATHRYVAIAAVGWIGLLAIAISFVQSKKLQGLVTIVIICLGIQTSWQWVEEWQIFRSREFQQQILDSIVKTLPEEIGSVSVGITGTHPIVLKTFLFSGYAPIVTLKSISTPEQFPYYSDNLLDIKPKTCAIWQKDILGKGKQPQDPLELANVYLFAISEKQDIVDLSETARRELLSLPCVVQ